MRFVIPGPLPGLNEYIEAERSNLHAAAGMKQKTQHFIGAVARSQHRKARFTNPVIMHYIWIEKDRRRDWDNVVFARKFIQDAFVDAGILIDDGQKYVLGFTDRFAIDPKRPRVEIEIVEVKK